MTLRAGWAANGLCKPSEPRGNTGLPRALRRVLLQSHGTWPGGPLAGPVVSTCGDPNDISKLAPQSLPANSPEPALALTAVIKTNYFLKLSNTWICAVIIL